MQRLRTRRWALIAVALAVGGGALATVSLGAISEPVVAARYSLSIGGADVAFFGDLKTITSEITPATTTSTGAYGTPKPAVIIFERALTDDLALSAWHQQALAGQTAARKNATLTAFGPDGAAVAQWLLEAAWPAKLEVHGVASGTGGQALTETVTLTARTIKRAPL
jgi:phage tail-like protein